MSERSSAPTPEQNDVVIKISTERREEISEETGEVAVETEVENPGAGNAAAGINVLDEGTADRPAEPEPELPDRRSGAERLDPYVPLLKNELEKLPADDYNWLKNNINEDRPADAEQAAIYDEMTTKYADLIRRIRLHMAHDPAHAHDVFANADDDISRRKNPSEWYKFKRRMGRMANVVSKYTFESPNSIDKYGRHYGQTPEYAYGKYSLINAVGVLAWNLVAGASGFVWNTTLGRLTGLKNSQSGLGKVASEKTIAERHQEEKDIISSHHDFIYTGGNFSGIGNTETLDPDKLKHVSWITRFLTGRQKDWHSVEDSYLGKKVNKHAITKPAEYDHDAPDYENGRKYKAHQIDESFKKDTRHSPNFQAVLKALSEIDPDNPPDDQDFRRQIQADSETFRQSGDTKHLEEQVEIRLAKLRRQLDTASGAIWDRYLTGDHNAPIAAGMSILQTMADEKKRLEETKKKAAEAEEAWRRASDQTDAMFDENEFEVNGQRRYFTTRTVKGSELPEDRRELILIGFDRKFKLGQIERWDAIGAAMQRKSGQWSAADASSIAMKQRYILERTRRKALEAFDNTDFVEYTVHIYNPDGTARRGEDGRDLTTQGQVVGYIDSRTGGLILSSGVNAMTVDSEAEAFTNAVFGSDYEESNV